jgi:hypothetical protein
MSVLELENGDKYFQMRLDEYSYRILLERDDNEALEKILKEVIKKYIHGNNNKIELQLD